jgi:DNA-binding transcriptional LysR family regulator
VELHQLRYFVTVAEELHFTRAARRLGVAQPSVSSQVRKLEAELGTPLFERAASGPRLTQAGEVFLPLARRALADVDDAVAQVREVDHLGRGRLVVGATPSLCSGLLPAALSRFHRAFPGITVSLFEEGSGGLVGRIESGEVELALVILPLRQAWLATRELAAEELVLVVGPGHDLWGRRAMGVAELQGVPLVMFREGYDLREATFTACHRAGFEPVLVTEGGEMDGVLSMVGAGLGAAVVPSIVAAAHPELHSVRFRPADLRRTIGLARRADRAPSRAAAAFREEVESLVRLGWPGVAPAGLVLLQGREAGGRPEA